MGNHKSKIGGRGWAGPPKVGAMDHFDEAYAAVQAALDAGARYADARVMVQRTESMTARDGTSRI
jgi:hypothetical protein